MEHKLDAIVDAAGLPRRGFLKVGLGFSLALTLAGTLPGCSGGAKAPAPDLAFLRPDDVALFSAIIPVVVLDLGTRGAAEQQALLRQTLANIDGQPLRHAEYRRQRAGAAGRGQLLRDPGDLRLGRLRGPARSHVQGRQRVRSSA